MACAITTPADQFPDAFRRVDFRTESAEPRGTTQDYSARQYFESLLPLQIKQSDFSALRLSPHGAVFMFGLG
jgi:hypothetical protein